MLLVFEFGALSPEFLPEVPVDFLMPTGGGAVLFLSYPYPLSVPFNLLYPLLSIKPRDQKRQLEGLLLIQPRVAERRVIQTQVLLGQILRAAHTFRHRLPRQLQVHAAQIAVTGAVDAQRLL